MASTPRRDPGSFRDPSGLVYHYRGRILRTISPAAAEQFRFAVESGLLPALVERGWVIGWTRPDDVDLGWFEAGGAERPRWAEVIEHPRLAFVSYPYEWTFGQLKQAAVRHLEIQKLALDHGVALSDSTAYNMQWVGAQPLHIDLLSFRRYRPGEIWAGYDQFCRQFLFPLLVDAQAGVPFQTLYRGDMEGVSVADVAALLPWRRKYLSLRGYLHVALRAKLDARAKSHLAAEGAGERRLGEKQYRGLLDDLAHWIGALRRGRRGSTYWAEYAGSNSYTSETEAKKLAFVSEFIAADPPAVLWDLGGNTGAYAEAALEAGAGAAVVIDGDLDSLDRAFARAGARSLKLTPIYMDLASPSSGRGWRENERKGLGARAPADAVMALALVHHLAIGRNVPLDDVVDWIMGLAPAGIIEFVPKSDPMVRQMLAHREDIFPDYVEETFRKAITDRGAIVKELALTPGGRLLVAFARDRSR